MSMEVVSDAASLEVELLQLPEVSSLALKSNLSFVETLFEQWLSLPESNRLVRFILCFSILESSYIATLFISIFLLSICSWERLLSDNELIINDNHLDISSQIHKVCGGRSIIAYVMPIR